MFSTTGLVIYPRKLVIQPTKSLLALPYLSMLPEDSKFHNRYTIVSKNTMVWCGKMPGEHFPPHTSIALRTTDPLLGQSVFSVKALAPQSCGLLPQKKNQPCAESEASHRTRQHLFRTKNAVCRLDIERGPVVEYYLTRRKATAVARR